MGLELRVPEVLLHSCHEGRGEKAVAHTRVTSAAVNTLAHLTLAWKPSLLSVASSYTAQ